MNNGTILIILFLQFLTKTIYTNKFISVLLLIGIIIITYFINQKNKEKKNASFTINDKKFKISSLLIIGVFVICLFYQSTILIFILTMFDFVIYIGLVILKNKIDSWVNS